MILIYELEKIDYARLLVGVMIVMNSLRDQVNAISRAVTGYEKDIAPKLQEIIDKSSTDEEANQLANEKFVIINEN